ncbi:MAG: ComF family protein [Verrucomicrobiota bacterium]
MLVLDLGWIKVFYYQDREESELVSRILHLKNLADTCRTWIEAPLRLIFPDVCQVCMDAAASAGEGYVCERCVGSLRRIQSPFCRRCGLPFDGEISSGFECPNCHGVRFFFESAKSSVVAKTLMLDLLHRFKYQGCLWLEPLFERLFLEMLSNDHMRQNWDCVLPVPLHSVRQRERGYNQSALLAEKVASGLDLPFYGKVLKRIAPTPSQTMLNRSERAENVANAFCVTGDKAVTSKCVLLIDDVLTTGATTNACAKVLLKAGVRVVSVRTLARGLGI